MNTNLTKLNIKPDESAEQLTSLSYVSIHKRSARSSIIWENNTMKKPITADFENWIKTDLEDWESYKYITNKKNTNPWYDVNDDFYVVLPNKNISFFPTKGSFCWYGRRSSKSYTKKPYMATEVMVDDMNDEFFESLTKKDREVIIGTAIENYHLNVFYKSKDCPNDMFQRNLLCDLIQKLKCYFKNKLILTYGERGCYYMKKLFKPKVTVEVKDVCGAGDTFLAGLVVHMLKHNDIEYAIDFAQECAGDVVSRKGVVVV